HLMPFAYESREWSPARRARRQCAVMWPWVLKGLSFRLGVSHECLSFWTVSWMFRRIQSRTMIHPEAKVWPLGFPSGLALSQELCSRNLRPLSTAVVFSALEIRTWLSVIVSRDTPGCT